MYRTQFIKSHNLNNKILVLDNKVLGNTKIGAEVYKLIGVGNDKWIHPRHLKNHKIIWSKIFLFKK